MSKVDPSPITPLQCTSALFSTIVLHAHARNMPDMLFLSLMVTVFSLWFHSTQNRAVVVFDLVWAHVYFAYTVVQLLLHKSKIIGFSAVLALTWARLCFCKEKSSETFWHVAMHCQVILGSHIYIAFLR